MDRNAAKRLGAKGDVNEVVSHPFFEGVDFEQLQLKNVAVPYKPDAAQMTLKETELASIQADSEILNDIKTEDEQDDLSVEKKMLIHLNQKKFDGF